MEATTSPAVDALRGLHPNARVSVTLGSQRYGVQVNASSIVKDYDAAVADAEHFKAEAEKWKRIALRLTVHAEVSR